MLASVDCFFWFTDTVFHHSHKFLWDSFFVFNAKCQAILTAKINLFVRLLIPEFDGIYITINHDGVLICFNNLLKFFVQIFLFVTRSLQYNLWLLRERNKKYFRTHKIVPSIEEKTIEEKTGLASSGNLIVILQINCNRKSVQSE